MVGRPVSPHHPKSEDRTMTLTLKSVSEAPDLLGESPVWDAENSWLYWVDGISRLVRRLDPATNRISEWQTPSTVGSIGLADGSALVCGLVDGIYRLDLASGKFEPLLKPEPVDPLVRFNDGKIDRQGRFLCGSMGLHADPLGKLWRIDAAGQADVLAEGIRISNSLCFSPDGTTMYFADSLEGTIRAYPYGDSVGPMRTLVDTRAWGSGPDGATVDAEGYLWVCLVLAGRIGRFAPDGSLDRLIDAPVDLPSSLAFGGEDLATLFVTSIKDSGSGRAISQHPDGGRLFAMTGLGARGIAETRFGRPAPRTGPAI
jgi:L-arabinonolactonase